MDRGGSIWCTVEVPCLPCRLSRWWCGDVTIVIAIFLYFTLSMRVSRFVVLVVFSHYIHYSVRRVCSIQFQYSYLRRDSRSLTSVVLVCKLGKKNNNNLASSRERQWNLYTRPPQVVASISRLPEYAWLYPRASRIRYCYVHVPHIQNAHQDTIK